MAGNYEDGVYVWVGDTWNRVADIAQGAAGALVEFNVQLDEISTSWDNLVSSLSFEPVELELKLTRKTAKLWRLVALDRMAELPQHSVPYKGRRKRS